VEGNQREPWGGGPGKPTHMDSGNHWGLSRETAARLQQSQTATEDSSIPGNTQSPVPATAADIGLIPARGTTKTKPSKPQHLSPSQVSSRKVKTLAWDYLAISSVSLDHPVKHWGLDTVSALLWLLLPQGGKKCSPQGADGNRDHTLVSAQPECFTN
jgi:hypothetical protein